jgi:hypothetical protein
MSFYLQRCLDSARNRLEWRQAKAEGAGRDDPPSTTGRGSHHFPYLAFMGMTSPLSHVLGFDALASLLSSISFPLHCVLFFCLLLMYHQEMARYERELQTHSSGSHLAQTGFVLCWAGRRVCIMTQGRTQIQSLFAITCPKRLIDPLVMAMGSLLMLMGDSTLLFCRIHIS